MADRGRLWRLTKLTLGTAIAVLALYFLVSRLVHDWRQIPFSELRFNIGYLVASYIILLALHFPLGALTWRLLLRSLGETLAFRKCLAIITVTQLGKYAPGKVWFTLGRMSLARAAGISEAKTLVSVVVETGFLLLSAILLFGIAVLLLPRVLVPKAVYLLFLLVPLCLVVVYPGVLNRLLGFALARLKQPGFALRLSYHRLLGILGLYTLDWSVQGTGCFLLINSFYPLPLAKLPVMLGAYALSWILGFIILIAPAGLGIREGIFTFVLKLIMAPPMAIIAALLTRVWMTTSEALMALVCLPLLGKWRHDGTET